MKAIITDLDRTLLHTDKTVSDETIKVLKLCREKGIIVVVATARPERSITKYQQLINFDAMITLNGARTIIGNNTINISIPKNLVINMLKKLENIEDAVISIETNEGIISNVDIEGWNPLVLGKLSQAKLPNEIYKILLSSNNYDLNKIMNDVIEENTYYSVANGDLFQIMNINATKWNGIQNLLNAFQINPKDVIYFGDDNDDFESIINCGTGIAVSNALDKIKNVANEIIGTNDEDAVASYIKMKIIK